MKYTLLLIFATTSCASPLCHAPDWYTNDGFCVITNGLPVDKEALDVAIEVTQLFIQLEEPRYSQERMNSLHADDVIQIEFLDHLIKDRFIGYCNGYWRGESSNIYAWNLEVTHDPCLAKTSLAHELIHMYLIGIAGIYGHQEGWFRRPRTGRDANPNTLDTRIDRFLMTFCKDF